MQSLSDDMTLFGIGKKSHKQLIVIIIDDFHCKMVLFGSKDSD